MSNQLFRKYIDIINENSKPELTKDGTRIMDRSSPVQSKAWEQPDFVVNRKKVSDNVIKTQYKEGYIKYSKLKRTLTGMKEDPNKWVIITGNRKAVPFNGNIWIHSNSEKTKYNTGDDRDQKFSDMPGAFTKVYISGTIEWPGSPEGLTWQAAEHDTGNPKYDTSEYVITIFDSSGKALTRVSSTSANKNPPSIDQLVMSLPIMK